MSRKPKKGYFVRGQFVAEGSELDLQLKAELKGSEISKTDLKRESAELQKLGESLMTLRADLFDALALPDKLVEALREAARITNFEGKRRQMQFVGKLMRGLDDDQRAAWVAGDHERLTIALMSGSVVRVMLLFFLLPAWGAIGGKLLLRERLGWRRLLTVLLCLAGVYTIVGGAAVFRSPLSLADLGALVSGIFYTLAGIANRAARQIPIASRTLMSFVGGTVVAVIGLFVHSTTIPALSPFVWIMLALFAFLWLMGGTALTTYGVTHVDASRASVLQVTELVVAVVSAVLIGGELLSYSELVGGGMILAASLIEAFSKPAAPKDKELSA